MPLRSLPSPLLLSTIPKVFLLIILVQQPLTVWSWDVRAPDVFSCKPAYGQNLPAADCLNELGRMPVGGMDVSYGKPGLVQPAHIQAEHMLPQVYHLRKF